MFTLSASRKLKTAPTLLSAALLVLVTFGVSYAQSSQTFEFDIPAQQMDQALKDFGMAADAQVMFTEDVVAGKRTRRLAGEMTSMQALDRLLADSGLTYEVTSSNIILVKAQQDSSSNGQSLNPQSPRQQDQSNSNSRASVSSNDPVAFTGRVTDITTGGNLDGALVVIVETDQRTSTDNLGRFRFPQVRPGNYTVRVSYLGYESASKTVRIIPGQDAQLNFELGGVADLGTIQVYGQRSARALALNQERTAENSTTVLSSDLLGQFEGATLAETLRRAPGIAFQEDPLTGDGTNVIVRGLAPDFNQIRLDGQRLAEGSGLGRSPAIGNLLTDSIDEVTISKTLLPSQDSNGAGGLIEITTRGPLDRDRRFASFSAEGGANDGFEDFQQFSGILSGKFGSSDQFGLSLSLQYREESKETVGYSYQIDGFGQYLPLGADGNPVTSAFSLDPRLTFPFEPGVDNVYPRNLLNFIGAVVAKR